MDEMRWKLPKNLQNMTALTIQPLEVRTKGEETETTAGITQGVT